MHFSTLKNLEIFLNIFFLVESMVDASSNESGLVDVLDGLIKHTSVMVPTSARLGLTKVSLPSHDLITSQHSTGSLTPPNYLRLLIRVIVFFSYCY